MSRVIQDSDDDLDDDLEEVHNTEAKVASPKQSTSDASSTEALRRQIEAAHRAHLQSQFSTTENQTSAAPEDSHRKRKVPAEFGPYGMGSRHTASKQLPVTYFKREKGVFDMSLEDLHYDENLVGRSSQPTDQHNQTNWVLEGTMREAYAQHNPNAMFPEPSSTVPNATLTQQRVLEGVLAPALLGSEADAERISFHPDASIPWSEYLKSPTNTGEQPKSSAQYSQHTGLPTSGPLLNDGLDLSSSQFKRRNSLTLVGCPLTEDESTDMVNDHQGSIVLAGDEFTLQAELPQARPLSTAHESIRSKTPSSSRNSRKTKRGLSLGRTSDDDLADLSLPEEKYKPRPSRSRSLKTGVQGSIDYSVRPEKATKASRPRRSTPASISVVNPPNTPDRIQQICDMGFTPSTSAMALKQNSGDVTQSVDWLITHQVVDDELASHTLQTSRDDVDQTLPDTDVQGHDTDLKAGYFLDSHAIPIDLESGSNGMTIDVAIPSVLDVKSPAKVQVVIPAKSPKVVPEPAAPEDPRRKVKHVYTTSNQSEATAVEDTVTEAKAEKKRGRGRPQKASKTVLSIELGREEVESPAEQVRDIPLNAIDGNAHFTPTQPQAAEDTDVAYTIESYQAGNSATENTKSTITASMSMPEPQKLPDRPEVERITPERIKKPVAREQVSNNKCKVPYRVGLSKRIRIAPLLRVIKK